ncbi:SKI-interacting protein SKIP, SNW domain protein [Kalmanozyma brasiliensis GHG001]|uniref:Pre-mRNA-processing protein 45 n=1 Tax=Kalmanozyma brasiliensis (strain GHG001) TaxID=1365824 RepID=V5ERN0_KALBG|nr:SKI-interacting protein SKIP, SNW domain protein [Kalmanozyma brasiliensis GHG001]EST05573.1 SKI-interacting protein SKIP, SNW domain protein [Kalmanozyma brasiliensis GHG001]
MATTLQSVLPAPKYAAAVSARDEDEDDVYDNAEAGPSTSASSSSTSSIPPYGQRASWRPRTQADFGNGGSYPECHIAQYPLDMGRNRSAGTSNKLAMRVDGEGNKRYDAIVKQGLRQGQTVQSGFKDLVPLSQRTDLKEKDRASGFERPSQEEVMSNTERTRLALEAVAKGKTRSALPKAATGPDGKQLAQFIRYTPGQQGAGNGTQRIIKMTEAQRDPLEPPRHRLRKAAAGPPSPPPPVLRSPPRKVTAQEQKDWMIPPAISNWKNNKGYTIPLDKRLAADGSGIKDVVINDNFAQFAEALHLADRHAREEVRQRSIMQQKLAAKEKAAKEEHLRNLAQRAREERAGFSSATPSVSGRGDDDDVASRLDDSDAPASSRAAPPGGGMSAMLAGYGSDSDSASGSDRSAASDDEDEGARERDRIREERRRERERELRMSNMGTEQRAKQMMREQNRDISEKVALGLAKPTASKESMTDSRLFNQESLSAGYGDEDSYNLYDKPLFSGSSAAAAIYRRPAGRGGADDIYNGAGDDGALEEELENNDRFGLGQSKFKGAEADGEGAAPGGGGTRSGPVQFEKDASDPFAINQFLEEAKRGIKRSSGLETAESRKKHRDEDDS